MNKKQFLEAVATEVKRLKKHTTPEEKSRLDLSIDPLDPARCIYGKLTGRCTNARAKELIDKCCIVTFDVGIDAEGIYEVASKTFSEIQHKVNGAPVLEAMFPGSGRTYRYFSVLEGYIAMKNAKVYSVVKFIKGETRTLNL